MASNLRPLPPPLSAPMIGEDGLVTVAWANYFENSYRYQLPRWVDINLGGLQLTRAVGNQPDLVALNGTDILGYAFDGGSSEEELHGAFELDHFYKEEGEIHPHVHWYPTNTGTGNVLWKLDYWIRGASINDTGTLTATSPASGTAWSKVDAEFGALDTTGYPIGLQVHFKLYRDPTESADTYASDAAIATTGVHVEKDTIGSLQEYEK